MFQLIIHFKNNMQRYWVQNRKYKFWNTILTTSVSFYLSVFPSLSLALSLFLSLEKNPQEIGIKIYIRLDRRLKNKIFFSTEKNFIYIEKNQVRF